MWLLLSILLMNKYFWEKLKWSTLKILHILISDTLEFQIRLIFLKGYTLITMCKRPIDVYMAVKTVINQECFKSGQLPRRDTILNGEFKGSLEECAFTCRFYSLCQGFSFNSSSRICYLQSRFSYSQISGAEFMISGPKQPCGT